MAYTLIPARALLHPAWLASLAVLALNDHLLKGSDLLPAALTGKLSDVAGLLVAPLLLAVVLRVRRRSAWLACHVAVGFVFAAIQLSPAAAAGWSALMGAVGFPWVITMDASDLLTLPVLALSAWGFVPAMRRSGASNARRSAEIGVAAVGLLCSAATSSPPPECADDQCSEPDWDEEEPPEPWEEPQLAPFETDVFIHNATGADQVIRIRPLRIDIQLDCTEISEAPGALLRSSVFDTAQTWTVPTDTNIPVVDHFDNRSSCYAAWVEADTLAPVIVFWMNDEVEFSQVPGNGRLDVPGQLLLQGGADSALFLDSTIDVRFSPMPREAKESGTCAAQPDAGRVGWSTPVPWGSAQVEAFEPGLDGCVSVDLLRGEQSVSWYLCMPASSFVFDVGDSIDIRPLETFDNDGFEIVALDELGEAMALPRLTVSSGREVPFIEGLDVAALPVYGCELFSEPACGSVEREMTVVAGGSDLPAVELWPGQAPTLVEGADRTLEMTLMRAQERFVLDAECAMGSDTLGPDLELVIAQFPERE